MSTAFDPIDVADVAMVPMTRNRAFGPGATQMPAMVT